MKKVREDEFDSDATVVDMDDLDTVIAQWDDDHNDDEVITNVTRIPTMGASISGSILDSHVTRPRKVALAADEALHAAAVPLPSSSISVDAQPVDGLTALHEKVHREQCDEMIYIRDTASWILPDVIQSMTEITGERKCLYTREYEEELIRQIEDTELDELEDEYSDDDETLPGDDDDDDDQDW